MTSFHVQHVETLLKRKVNDIVFCFTFMMYVIEMVRSDSCLYFLFYGYLGSTVHV